MIKTKRQQIYRKRQNIWRNNVPEWIKFGKALDLTLLAKWFSNPKSK